MESPTIIGNGLATEKYPHAIIVWTGMLTLVMATRPPSYGIVLLPRPSRRSHITKSNRRLKYSLGFSEKRASKKEML